jgi:hypothetical protein
LVLECAGLCFELEQPDEFYPQVDDFPPNGNPHPLQVSPNVEEGEIFEGLVNQNLQNLQGIHTGMQ